MHFVFLIPVGAGFIWLLFFVLAAEAAPGLVGGAILLLFMVFLAFVFSALELWPTVFGFAAIIAAVIGVPLVINFLISSITKMLQGLSATKNGYSSPEAREEAILRAKLGRAEANAKRSSRKAVTAREEAVKAKGLFGRFLSEMTADKAENLAINDMDLCKGAANAWKEAKARSDARDRSERAKKEAKDASEREKKNAVLAKRQKIKDWADRENR